jgi:hypothetical protein
MDDRKTKAVALELRRDMRSLSSWSGDQEEHQDIHEKEHYPATTGPRSVRIEQAADIVGLRAVMVHAIDETARRFYEHLNSSRRRAICSCCSCSYLR